SVSFTVGLVLRVRLGDAADLTLNHGAGLKNSENDVCGFVTPGSGTTFAPVAPTTASRPASGRRRAISVQKAQREYRPHSPRRHRFVRGSRWRLRAAAGGFPGATDRHRRASAADPAAAACRAGGSRSGVW